MSPERQCLYGVAERSNLATTRLVVIATTVDHNLLELEVVHVLDVDFRRHYRHAGCTHGGRPTTSANYNLRRNVHISVGEYLNTICI